jgi:hypothetical protein
VSSKTSAGADEDAAKKAAAEEAAAKAAEAKKAEEAAAKAAEAKKAEEAAAKKAAAKGPLVKEAIHHDGRLYEPGSHLPAGIDPAVLARHQELGNI